MHLAVGRRQEREETGSGAGRGGDQVPQFASDVLALKVLHLEKHLRLKQARTIAQPTKEEEENCRHCLSTGILSQSTLSHGESRLGNPAPRCPALKLQ